MAAGKWKVYNSAKERLCQADIDLNGHTFMCALFTSASNANTLTLSNYADVTNEVANGFGYTTGGFALTTTWDPASDIITFDSNDPFWDASGGSITARYAVIYDLTSATDALLCIMLLDNVDVTINSGEELKIIMAATGVFTLSGAITD